MGRNVYIGKWVENTVKDIEHQYTYENLMYLLRSLGNSKSPLTHQEFVQWCEKYFFKLENEEDKNAQDNAIANLVEVLGDISTQWELYLLNTYSLQLLQNLDFSTVHMPSEWFFGWAEKLQKR